ncbi:unnamed protein product, partial [Polarella glacialis]
ATRAASAGGEATGVSVPSGPLSVQDPSAALAGGNDLVRWLRLSAANIRCHAAQSAVSEKEKAEQLHAALRAGAVR